MSPRRAWILLAVLNVVVLLPGTLGLDTPAPWLALGLSVDLLSLAALVAWMARLGLHKAGAALGGLVVLALLVFEIMRLVGVFAMSQDPLLYDLGFLLRHAVVLLMDIGTLWDWLGVVGVCLLPVLLATGAAWAIHRASPTWGNKAPWLSGLAVLVFALSFLGRIHPGATRWPARFILPHMVENLSESVRVYRSVTRTQTQDPYAQMRLQPLSQAPEVRIFIVESYGELAFTEEGSAEPLRAHLRELEAALGEQGWYSLSGRSVAPVSGGRSWIADATLYSGVEVSYESVFQHLKPGFGTNRTLPAVLHDAGYHTVVVEPKDRARPGVELENEFNFDQTVFYADLDWQGPEWGWGLIPDQYTLGWLRENALAPAADRGQPVFLSFHMVASHVPWRSPPPLVADWRTLDQEPLAEDHDKAAKRKAATTKRTPDERTEATRRLGRYKREAGMQHGGQGSVRDETLSAYLQLLHYDLEAIAQHLGHETERPTLVIIMGDHQPPFLTKRMSFSVPVHVLATDPALLREFESRGFQPGLVPPDKGPAELSHQAMFSALIRSLARYDGQPAPQLHTQGVKP